MPKVYYVPSARKTTKKTSKTLKRARKAAGIKEGMPYYYWTIRKRRSVRYLSVTKPRRSQLVSSDFKREFYRIQERLEDALKRHDGNGCVITGEELGEIVDAMADLAEEQAEKYNNMNNGLRETKTGQLLKERADACKEWREDVRTAAFGRSELISLATGGYV